jgi:hypothetical protein
MFDQTDIRILDTLLVRNTLRPFRRAPAQLHSSPARDSVARGAGAKCSVEAISHGLDLIRMEKALKATSQRLDFLGMSNAMSNGPEAILHDVYGWWSQGREVFVFLTLDLFDKVPALDKVGSEGLDDISSRTHRDVYCELHGPCVYRAMAS